MDYSILYFAFVSSNYGGIEQKVIDQFNALKKIGANINLFLISDTEINRDFSNEINKNNQIHIINKKIRIRNPFLRRKEKFKAIIKELDNYNSNKVIIYFRFPASDFYFYNFIRKVKKRGFLIVTEHQQFENPWRKKKFNGYLYIAINDFIFGKKVRKLLDGFVGVTNEILEYQQSYLKFQKPGIVIPNGINCEKFKLRKIPKYDGKLINILFVGAGYKTHGLHRVIEGMNIFINKQRNIKNNIIKIYIVGSSKEMDYNIKLVKKYNLQSYFNFIPAKFRSELDKYYDQCHIAIGNLGYHRIGLSEASIIKIREYFCRGIPFITSPIDSDISKKEMSLYYLMLPQNETPVCISDVINFVDNLYYSNADFSKMRRFAFENLVWNFKMKKLIYFFSKIISENKTLK